MGSAPERSGQTSPLPEPTALAGYTAAAVPVPAVGIPAEIPFHSLSYPDIDYTVMRPAALPPTAFTTPVPNPPAGLPAATLYTTYNAQHLCHEPRYAALSRDSYTGDPGVRNYYLYAPDTLGSPACEPGQCDIASMGDRTAARPALGALPVHERRTLRVRLPRRPAAERATRRRRRTGRSIRPPIPPRRLFQTPDAFNPALAALPTNVTPTPSNASETGDPTINLLTVIPNPAGRRGCPADARRGASRRSQYGTGAEALDAGFDQQRRQPLLAGRYPGDHHRTAATGHCRLLNAATPRRRQTTTSTSAQRTTGHEPSTGPASLLAHRAVAADHEPDDDPDPSVRRLDHDRLLRGQAAGGPGDVRTNPQLAFDIMGPEIGAANGKTTRYRGFFLVDRLQLTGFNPTSPSGFRAAVMYRKRIQ